MAEWLFEIFSEEMPSAVQQGAQEQLWNLAEAELTKANLYFETIRTFSTPRRLTLVVDGLPLQTLERTEEKKGPREDALPTAIEGFLKNAQVTREECVLQKTPKGMFLFAVKKAPPQPTEEVLTDLSLSILKAFRWPRTMRWPLSETPWIRPLRGFVNLFDGKLIPFSYAGVEAFAFTRGHRFMAPVPFEVKNFEDYKQKLREHFVILDRAERQALIKQEVARLAQAAGLIAWDEDRLLDEVTGLTEWPVALKGKIEDQFMDLPLEVITTPMRVHQRYVPLRHAEDQKIQAFVVISNVEDRTGHIIEGNEKVLRARLADAKFFWDQDRKYPLEHFNIGLATRLFHHHLGSLSDKVRRLEKVAPLIAKTIGVDEILTQRATLLSKSDLMSQMVNEFPELQGIMGRYYAVHQGEPAEVALAIEEQYLPKGMGGGLPVSDPGKCLAIADRVDTLIGFFAIGIEPTGSKDPYALRRAALGLIGILLECSPISWGEISGLDNKISLLHILEKAYESYPWGELSPPLLKSKEETVKSVRNFLLERFKFFLREKYSSPYDHVDAVLSIANSGGSFASLAARVAALGDLLNTEAGQNLRSASKRATNILRIAEENEGCEYEGKINESLLIQPQERSLFDSIQSKLPEITVLSQQGQFSQAVRSLSDLRAPVDAFFEAVTVNTSDEKTRHNRLHLLALMRKTLHQVANFSKLEGENDT